MCGLAFALSKRGKNTGEYVYSLFEKQKSRGQQGFGCICIDGGKITKIFRSKFATEIQQELKGNRSDIVLFHHRLPTSTKNTIGTAHPMFISNPSLKFDYYFAHNGVINNAGELKKKHNELGYSYLTEFTETTKALYQDGTEEVLSNLSSVFNDSESLAIELARWIEGYTDSVDTQGGAAFWGIQVEKGTQNVVSLYYGKNKGRDLKEFNNKNWFSVSSESGSNSEDMKLFTMTLSTGEWMKEDLPIDEAAPTELVSVGEYRRTGFQHSNSNTQLALPHKSDVGDGELRWESSIMSWVRMDSPIPSPLNLQDCYYTFKEANETGFPISEFYKRLDNNGNMMYVPIQFMGSNYADIRQPISMHKPVNEQYNTKEVELLDGYIEDMLKYEDSITDLGSCFDRGYISRASFDKHVSNNELEIEVLQSVVSALGLSEEFIEERIEAARDVHDYNTSYEVKEQDLQLIKY